MSGWGDTTAVVEKAPKKIQNIKPNDPIPYKFDKSKVKKLDRIESSLLPNGYIRGTFYGYIGVPGSGKTRLAIQEVLLSALKGSENLYLYNESSRSHFDNVILNIANSMHVEVSSNITFTDMSNFIQKTAGYNDIESFYSRIWCQQTKHWLETVKNPGFVVTDSFSAIGRLFIPQMWVSHSAYISGLTDICINYAKPPVFLMINQKSGSTYERNNDQTVGGLGIVHQLDAMYIFKVMDVDRWDTKRYGLKEGSKAYFLQCSKDRFATSEYFERRVILKDGKMVLADEISELVEKQDESQKSSDGNVNWG